MIHIHILFDDMKYISRSYLICIISDKNKNKNKLKRKKKSKTEIKQQVRPGDWVKLKASVQVQLPIITLAPEYQDISFRHCNF